MAKEDSGHSPSPQTSNGNGVHAIVVHLESSSRPELKLDQSIKSEPLDFVSKVRIKKSSSQGCNEDVPSDEGILLDSFGLEMDEDWREGVTEFL